MRQAARSEHRVLFRLTARRSDRERGRHSSLDEATTDVFRVLSRVLFRVLFTQDKEGVLQVIAGRGLMDRFQYQEASVLAFYCCRPTMLFLWL